MALYIVLQKLIGRDWWFPGWGRKETYESVIEWTRDSFISKNKLDPIKERVFDLSPKSLEKDKV